MKTPSSRRRSLPHAQIHLPPLDAGYALTLVGIFERAIDAIWRAHGDRMAELRGMRDHRGAVREEDCLADDPADEWVPSGNPDAPEDTPF